MSSGRRRTNYCRFANPPDGNSLKDLNSSHLDSDAVEKFSEEACGMGRSIYRSGTDLGVVFERQMQARSRSGKLGIHLDVLSPSRGLGRSFVDKARN